MFTAIAIGSLLVSTVLAPPAVVPQSDPPTGQVTIDKLKVNGTGCRPAATTVAVSPDKKAFTVIYSTYLAQAGAGTTQKDERRTCSITVRLNGLQNLTYAVAAVDYRGYAHLEPGAAAALAARYHFQGAGAPDHTVTALPSGLDDNWQVTDAVPAGSLKYGQCGKDRKLDIDTELRVQTPRADSPTSYVTMDSTDGSVATTYRLVWKSCG
jgi:hypothetical protein